MPPVDSVASPAFWSPLRPAIIGDIGREEVIPFHQRPEWSNNAYNTGTGYPNSAGQTGCLDVHGDFANSA